jgi:DHA1 family bicyclomycin/chloramphenicol resistance-like MFS transporter
MKTSTTDASTDASNLAAPRQPPLLLLVGISALGPITLNGVLPANTAVMKELAVDYSAAQLVLTVYLFATMISQLALGNLSDRIGRRPVMIGSMLVFAGGSLICAAAMSIEVLLAGRFVQGFGAAVCVFLTRTIMRDVHSQDKAASAIGYMNTAMMVAPMFGPALCGYITDVSSWRIMYMLLAALATLFALLSYRYQNETLVKSNDTDAAFVSGARVLLGEAEYRAYLWIICGAVGMYFCFLAGAPYVAMELRGHSASTFGIWFSMVAIGYLCGNFVAGRYSQRFGTSKMIGLSIIPAFIGMLFFWAFSGSDALLALFLPMQLIAFSNGICLPNVTSAAMSVRTSLAGTASGLTGTIQIFTGILLSLLVGVLISDHAWPLFALMTLCLWVCIGGYQSLRQK